MTTGSCVGHILRLLLPTAYNVSAYMHRLSFSTCTMIMECEMVKLMTFMNCYVNLE